MVCGIEEYEIYVMKLGKKERKKYGVDTRYCLYINITPLDRHQYPSTHPSLPLPLSAPCLALPSWPL